MKLLPEYKFFLLFILIQLVINISFSNKVFGQSQIQQFDDRIMLDLQAGRTPQQTSTFLFLSNTYRYGDIGVPIALFIGGAIDNNKGMRENAVYVGSSTALSYGLMLLIKAIVKRPRPFVQNLNIIPVYRAGSTSFPSGHAASTFATATALARAYPKWYIIGPAFLWAGSVSYSRMYLGEHYPTDVTAGALLGAGSAFALSPLKK
jgi:undecaprenyl-diphosphatase